MPNGLTTNVSRSTSTVLETQDVQEAASSSLVPTGADEASLDRLVSNDDDYGEHDPHWHAYRNTHLPKIHTVREEWDCFHAFARERERLIIKDIFERRRFSVSYGPQPR